MKSYFDGSTFQLVGYKILGFIITFFTLGICYPLAFTMVYNWETKHSVIEGKRLRFDGTGMQLFGNWLKWWLFSLLTLGIYLFFVSGKIRKWKAKHTHFAS